MLARRLIALCLAILLGCTTTTAASAQSHSRSQIETLAQFYAQYYDVPLELVRRVINRESTFNPSARNGPYYGLMQILPATARTMGFRGEPADLLNAETNLIYAVKYLRGAWLLAGGSHDRAVQLYARGYYYDAKAAGLLEETGLRPGPASPIAPAPPTAGAPPIVIAAAEPQVVEAAPQQSAPVVTAALETVDTASPVALGFLPPARPLGLVLDEVAGAEPESEALTAIASAQTITRPLPDPEPPVVAMAMAATQPVLEQTLRPSIDLIASTFDLLDTVAGTLEP